MKAQKIGTEVYYPVPMHNQECFVGFQEKGIEFPISGKAAAETLALPIYPELTPYHIHTVVEVIKKFLCQSL